MLQAKKQAFRNQIRRKQRQHILDELRKQFNNSQLNNFDYQYQWGQFIKHQGTKIPNSVCTHFDSINFQLQQIQICVERLDPTYIVNIVFAAYIMRSYGIESPQILDYTLKNWNQIEQQIPKGMQFLTFNGDACILYWCTFLETIHKTSQNTVESIIANFQQIRKHRMPSTLHPGIASHFIAILHRYNYTSKVNQLGKQFAYQILSKDNSVWAYRLILDLIKKDFKCVLEIGMHPSFSNFLYAGVNIDSITIVLGIVNVFLENVQITLKVNIEYERIAHRILDLYMMKDMEINQQKACLRALYNLANSQIPILQHFFSCIDYQKLAIKTQGSNMMEFIDFCSVVLILYCDECLCSNILLGDKFSLLQYVKMEVLKEDGDEQIFQDFLCALEECIRKQLEKQKISQYIQYFIQKIKNLITNWRSHQKLLQRCEELRKSINDCRQ